MKRENKIDIFIGLLLISISYFLSVNIVRFLNIQSIELIVFLVIIILGGVSSILIVRKVKAYSILNEKLEEQSRIRSAILSLAQDMTTIHSTKELHDLILKTAVNVMSSASMGSIMILDEPNTLKFTSVVGFDLEELEQIKVPLNQTYLFFLNNEINNKALIINNTKNANISISGEANKRLNKTMNTDLIETTISSPIFINDKLYGLMNVDSKIEHAFKDSDLELMDFFVYEVVKVIELYDTIEENNRLSKFDSLTNLYNRRYLHYKLEKLTLESDLFTLMSIDINNLKNVNDSFGHDFGDLLILAFVSGINIFLSDKDLFSRYGGDEFIIVFDNKTKEDIQKMFETKVLPYFSETVIHEDMKDIKVSFSYGLTTYPEDALNYEKLMIKADQLMYINKKEQYKK